MKLMTGHAVMGAGIDVDATAMARLHAAAPSHAVREGSPTTVCGAPVGDVSEQPWPPDGERCGLCEQIVASFAG